jgi:hypothetical protein
VHFPAASNSIVLPLSEVDEMVEALLDACMHGAAIIRAQGNSGDFEAVSVVALDQSDDEMNGGMIAVIGGEVADADAVARGPGRRISPACHGGGNSVA